MASVNPSEEHETRSVMDVIKDELDALLLDMKNDSLKYFFVVPVLIFFLYFLVIPVLQIFSAAFLDASGDFSLDAWKFVFTSETFFDWNGREATEFRWFYSQEGRDETFYVFNGDDYGIVLNSIIIAVLTTVLSTALGVGLALFMAKREFVGKQLVSIGILIPLIIPPFVGGLGFFSMVGRNGLLNEYFFAPLFGIRIIVGGTLALVFVEAFHYYTLVYLNVYSSLINVDPSLEEQAKNMGASGSTLMRTITLPLALPGIAAGAILTFILSLEDLGTPIVFAENGDTIAEKTMTFYIFDNLDVLDPDSVNVITPDSAVIGTILLVIALIGFFIIRKYVAMRNYSMEGKGRAGDRNIPRANGLETVLFYFFYIFIFLFSVISHVGIILRAFNIIPNTFDSGLFKGAEFNLDNYRFIFSSANNVVPFIYNTIVFSFMSLFIIVIFGTMAAYAIARFEFKGKSLFDALITIPIALPGVVIGLGYLVMFTDSPQFSLRELGINTDFVLTLDPFAYPVLLLICSYAVRKFPFAVRSIYAGIQQTSVDLEEAAQNVGASQTEALSVITIPLILLNIVAGSLIALVYTISEVSTTLVLVSDESYGTVTWYMGNSVANRIGIFAAMGSLLMVLQIASIIASNFLLKNRAEAMTGI